MLTRYSDHAGRLLSTLISIGIILALLLPGSVFAQTAKVQVVLFYSPFCGHCQQVISEELPPIVENYNASYTWSYYGDPPDEQTGQLPPIVAFEGDVLQLLYVDTTTQVGGDLYLAAAARFQIAPEDQAVPTLIIGDTLLVGSIDIPSKLPGLIKAGLEDGGLAWPDIPGLEELVAELRPLPSQLQPSATPSDAAPENLQATPQPEQRVYLDPDPGPTFELDVSKLTPLQRIRLDPVGNSLAIVVLIGMILSLTAAGIRWRSAEAPKETRELPLPILVLAVLGIMVSAYLSFVSTSGTEAVCGPIGDCNTVQTSEYATILGSIPNGFLGLLAYTLILAAWILSRAVPHLKNLLSLSLFGIAFLGTLFSLYLTSLEPFVIGATCMWCVSSAVSITLIMLLSVDTARAALAHIRT